MAHSGDDAVGSILDDSHARGVNIGTYDCENGGSVDKAGGDETDVGQSAFEDLNIVLGAELW